MSQGSRDASPTMPTPTMSADDVERAYERLARAIDTAGPDREALFLTRLALLLAHRVGGYDLFDEAVRDALGDDSPQNLSAPTKP